MNKAEQIKQLEQTLTELLGKSSYTTYKRACTGKWRGSFDYGLRFEGGTEQFYISTGRKYYHRNLTHNVQMYSYFRENHEALTLITKKIIERDNRQAVSLGLSPIEFLSLGIQPGSYANFPFMIVVEYDYDNWCHCNTWTEFSYACQGISINSSYKTSDDYLNFLIHRRDAELGQIENFDKGSFTHIFLGHLL